MEMVVFLIALISFFIGYVIGYEQRKNDYDALLDRLVRADELLRAAFGMLPKYLNKDVRKLLRDNVEKGFHKLGRYWFIQP